MGSAELDFSGVNAGNISKLYDKGFSFTCTQGCSESFNFTFNNGKGDSFNPTAISSTRYKNDYDIDISGCTTGADITKKIFDYVYANPPTVDGGQTLSDTQAIQVGHANALFYDSTNPDKLVVFSTTEGTSNWGEVDCSGITPDAGKIKKFWIQASGSSPDDGMTLEVSRMDAKYIGIDQINVSDQDGAKDAIDVIKDATSMISAMRSDLGAYQNRLEHAYANNMNKAENTTAAESRIRDTDMAEMMMKFTKDNILAQATEAMMAQANQSTQGVLSLLQ